MSAGLELLKSLKAVRQFFADVGQLLLTAEGMMAEQSWEPIGDAGCLVWTSAMVTKSSHWIPRFAARHYVCPQQFPNVVAIISVLIDDFEIGKDFKLTEPVVSASFFVLPEETSEEHCRVDRWNALWLGYGYVEADGTPYSIDSSHDDWQETHRWKFMTMFGWPLVDIGNQESLKAKIVDPLIQLMVNNRDKVT